ncbi:polyprenyl diphosphate synthase [Nannocystis pusilla]|uniref:polyprenyl diphosphate synthase n=1 Tax=Nannocystis pusilla TaxID=889268 RepID=UPI003B77E5FF
MKDISLARGADPDCQIQGNLDRDRLPKHLGIVLDGNRRWARARRYLDVSEGHRIGFEKIPEVLAWCDDRGIRTVTLWMLSSDNIRNRSQTELEALYEIDEDVVRKLVATRRFRVRLIGCSEMLPDRLSALLREAEQETAQLDAIQVNLAIGYGGREDLLDAISSLITESLATGDTDITAERLAAHLSTAGQPDPDLIIRTSGEKRTSGFLLWQAALAEYYFCDCHWPDFSESDLDEALRTYGARQRRFGA